MRKSVVTTLIAATLLLAACGGDDATTSSEQTGGSDATAEETPADEPAAGAGGPVDLEAAVLTTEDMPAGVDAMPIAITGASNTVDNMAEILEDVTYEPADCRGGENGDPVQKDGVEATGMTAVSDTDVLIQAAYTPASGDDLSAIEDYYARCGEIAISGTVGGRPLDMTITTEVVDGPDVDADEVLAVDSTTVSAGLPTIVNRVVYVIEGGHGVYLAVNPESTVFDVDALAAAALEKLRAARG